MSYINAHFILKIAITFTFAILNLGLPALAENKKPIKVGWIGAMTGPTAKWGVSQAALLAEDEINQSGGINGRSLKMIMEDTGCKASSAVSAFRKLTQVDGVSFILGGHCSPDSLAIAPLAEKQKIVMIAAITSSPKLTNAGQYIFRVTPVSTKLADLIVPYAQETLQVKKLSLVYELTDYVVPVAEKLKADFEQGGGTITDSISFNPGESDFRSMLLKATSGRPDAVYFGVQAPDTALLLVKQFRELNSKVKIFGNEQFAGAFASLKPEESGLLEDVVFAQPECDIASPPVKSFSEKYTKRFQVSALPFGCYTAEAFDSAQLLAAALRKCGENTECVRSYLEKVNNYPGSSGSITFDENGDVIKNYVIGKISNGRIMQQGK
jgi:branched-chain amino acid transport system substrate-binding protein